MKILVLVLLTSLIFAQGRIYWDEDGAAIKLGGFDGAALSPAVPTEDGGMIVAWEHQDPSSGYKELRTQKIDINGNRLWDTAGVIVSSLPASVKGLHAVSDGEKGTIVTWGTLGDDYDIVAARIDSTGDVIWSRVICDAMLDQKNPSAAGDGQGGAVIAWIDSRHGTLNYDIYVQRVNSSGNRLWQSQGIALTTSHDVDPMRPQMVAFPEDSCAVITWAEHLDNDYCDVVAQKILYDGTLAWSSAGLVVCDDDSSQGSPRIASSNDSMFIAWHDIRNGNLDVYLQLIDLEGNLLLGSSGIPVDTRDGGQALFEVTAGNSGEIVLAIQDHSTSMRRLYLQKVNSSGELCWSGDTGVYIASPAPTQASLGYYIDLSSDDEGGGIVTWKDYRSDSADIYAQHVSSDGVCMWDSGGMDICVNEYEQRYGPRVCTDGSGGAIIAWGDHGRPGVPYASILAQRVGDALCGDANGDESVTTGDGYYILNYFGNGPPPVSMWAANVNGDGQLTTGDGYHLLNWFGVTGELTCGPVED